MRRILKRNTVEPHDWFAWHPVIAECTTPVGVVYYLVLFETVQRSFIRVQGIVQWKYRIKE